MFLFGLIVIIFLYISSNMMIHRLTQSQEIGESSIKSSKSLPQVSYHNETNDSKFSSGLQVSYAGSVMSRPNCNKQIVQSPKENLTTNAYDRFRLFGVDLTTSTKARDVLQALDSYQKTKISEILEEENLDQIQAVTSATEFQRNEISSNTSKGVVRSVDLTVFDGYNHMIVELEKLFNIKDSCI
ncbi:unnamed protein product [Brassica rapa subsp. narinosa]